MVDVCMGGRNLGKTASFIYETLVETKRDLILIHHMLLDQGNSLRAERVLDRINDIDSIIEVQLKGYETTGETK